MELQSDQSREESEKRAQESSASNAEEVLRLFVRLRARCARSGWEENLGRQKEGAQRPRTSIARVQCSALLLASWRGCSLGAFSSH